MANCDIRAATTDDAAALSALIQEAVRISNARDYSAAIIDLICANFVPGKIIEKMGRRDVFAAVDETGIVGTISLGGDRLHSMFVRARRQSQGIGRRLVAHLEAHALTKGLSSLHLSSSMTAKPFYEKLGYELVRFEARDDGSTYLMRKSLP